MALCSGPRPPHRRGKRTCVLVGLFPPKLPRQGPCRKDTPRGIAVCLGWAGWAPVSQGSFWKVQLDSAGSSHRESFQERRGGGAAQQPFSGQEGEVHRPAWCAWGHTPEPGGPGTQAASTVRGPAPRVPSVGWELALSLRVWVLGSACPPQLSPGPLHPGRWEAGV